MNDKDKEAFDVWVWDNFNLTYELNPSQYDDLKDSWQAACEYKQKETDDLNKYVEFQANVMCDMGEVILENEKLQAENAELKLLTKQFEKIIKDRQDELNYLVNKVEELQAENAKLNKFISALGYDQVVDDVVESLEKLEYK